MTVSVVVGNPRPRSRTYDAAVTVAQRLTDRAPDHVFDLVEFGSALLDWTSAAVASAVETVTRSDLVVIATPTYKGTYTGLLKLFLDRFGAGTLASTSAVPVMLGGDWRHSLAPEVSLKPVLAELGASCPTRGLFLLDSEWQTGATLDDWVTVARRQLPVREGVAV